MLLEFCEQAIRVAERPVAQHQHIFAVIGDRISALRINDDRPVMADLFLQAGMGMVPIGAVLRHGIFVGEGLARLDARKGDARHAVHLERYQQAMPVDGGVGVQPIGDLQRHFLAFAEAQQRCRRRTIDANRFGRAAIDTHRKRADRQVEPFALQCRDAEIAFAGRTRPSGIRACSGERGAAGGIFEEVASVQHGLSWRSHGWSITCLSSGSQDCIEAHSRSHPVTNRSSRPASARRRTRPCGHYSPPPAHNPDHHPHRPSAARRVSAACGSRG